jgi:glycosidase
MISTSWWPRRKRAASASCWIWFSTIPRPSTPGFAKSLNKESPYRQFYIWRDGEPTTPPNNWRSKFGGNAWQWHADSEQYYLHLFAVEQADLNWENPAVRAELKKVCEFWADRGVDGLRLDVVNLISKDQTFPPIPRAMAAAFIPTARGSTNSCRR